MSDKRTFVASSELFSDFKYEISMFHVETIEDILVIFKEKLSEILRTHNLTQLDKKLQEAEFHIHGKSIEEIFTSNSDEIFYICDHS